MTRKIDEPTASYLDARDIDTVMRLNTNLLSEVWLLRDRLAVMEHLLKEKAIFNNDEIDNFVPDAEMNSDLEKLRSQFIERAVRSSVQKSYTVKSLIESVGAS